MVLNIECVITGFKKGLELGFVAEGGGFLKEGVFFGAMVLGKD